MRFDRYSDKPSEYGTNNRGQRKADSHALRDDAAALVAMVPARLAKLGLDTFLARAIEEAQAIASLPARNRQLQIVRKILEGMEDDEIKALRFAMSRVDHVAPKAAEPDETVVLAARLLDEGDEGVFSLAEQYGREALQPLRQAVRAARKKLDAGGARDEALKAVRTALLGLTAH